MVKLQNKAACCGCAACSSVCPAQCITMTEDAEGFLYPEVHSEACLNCGKCEAVCPLSDPPAPARAEAPAAWAACAENGEIRSGSSSGGVFTLAAKAVLDRGGVVFGAAFSEDFSAVVHREIERTEDLPGLRGAKYVQSRIGDAYRRAEAVLQQGRPVLFTGTPCQIGGLLAALGRGYEKLYTLDFVCHGVPSEALWRDYLKLREEKAGGSPVRQVSFRDKRDGWKQYALLLNFQNGRVYRRRPSEDLYMNAFLRNLSLRPSCYQCGYKGVSRPSDLTLGDFWGAETVVPELDAGQGLSLVLVHSEKGEALLRQAGAALYRKAVPLDAAVKGNPSAVDSPPCPSEREAFFQAYRAKGAEAALNAWCKPAFGKRIRHLIQKIIRRP